MRSESFARIYFKCDRIPEEMKRKICNQFSSIYFLKKQGLPKKPNQSEKQVFRRGNILLWAFPIPHCGRCRYFGRSKTEATLKSIRSAFSLSLLNKDAIAESCAISYYSVKSDVRGHSLPLTALGTLAQ